MKIFFQKFSMNEVHKVTRKWVTELTAGVASTTKARMAFMTTAQQYTKFDANEIRYFKAWMLTTSRLLFTFKLRHRILWT